VVAYLAMAVNSYEYFFAPPVVTEILIAVCLGLAWMSAGARAGAENAVPATAR
jgi:hypothetical protein